MTTGLATSPVTEGLIIIWSDVRETKIILADCKRANLLLTTCNKLDENINFLQGCPNNLDADCCKNVDNTRCNSSAML